MATESMRDYIQALEKELALGNSTEHTHRPTLKETIRLMVEIDELIPVWPIK